MSTFGRGARFDLVMMMLGAVCFAVAIAWSLFSQLEYNDLVATNPVPHTLGLVLRVPAALFWIAGMTGLHNRQKASAGTLGRVGFGVSVIALVLFAVLVAYWGIGWLLLHLGATLFGIAALRAGVLPRGAARLLSLGVPVGFVGGIALESAFGGSQGWGPFVGTAVVVAGFVWLAAPRSTAASHA